MRLPTSVANELASRILDKAIQNGVLPRESIPGWSQYVHFRNRVREEFEVPETSITPLMARILYGIAAIYKPKRVLGIGTYVGNALVWLVGPGFGPDALYEGHSAVGVDISPEAIDLAKRNFFSLGMDDRIRHFCDDGLVVPEKLKGEEEWDLIYLDADDPIQRKRIYLSLLDAVYGRVRIGGLILAHDICVPLFRDDMAAYQLRVRDDSRFLTTMSLEIDPCGLEVSVKGARAHVFKTETGGNFG